MGEYQPKKKGHSVGLSKVIGIVLVTLLVGMALGGYLGLAVVGPELQKLGLNIGNMGNNGNQNNNNNNNQNSNPNNNNNNGNNNNQNTGDQNNNNNNNQNSNQGPINNNPPPTNMTSSYGGSGQFDITMSQNGNTLSGVITANINCGIQQDGSNIILALSISPTNVPNSLQQAITVGNGVSFNFLGTISNSQFNANAKGTVGGGDSSFDLNLSGSMDQNSLTFTLTSASDSQLSVSNQHSITLHPI
jgi:hypothetical protein